MQITDVRLRKVNSENRMKAVASVTFDNEFVIHDIKVIESQNGLFIAMPSRKTPNGEFKDIAHPINQEARKIFTDAILAEYEAELSREEHTLFMIYCAKAMNIYNKVYNFTKMYFEFWSSTKDVSSEYVSHHERHKLIIDQIVDDISKLLIFNSLP